MLRIGTGAGFSGDRIEPAEILLKHANLDYLVMECLAERTISLAQKRKYYNANEGYDPLLEKRIRRILPLLLEKGVRLITNMGAANPIDGARKIKEISDELKLSCKVAAVTGDDVSDKIDKNTKDMDKNQKISHYEPIISANAYLGIDAILPALETEADIIITGRVADPSLFLAPQVYHYKWSKEDYKRLGQGTVNGHLLECSSQISGGYFADGNQKKVENIAHIGFPYAEIDEDGRSIIKKVEGTGGLIDLRTVKEQLLYEVHNPAEYITPDVIADFTSVQLKEIEKNTVEVRNGSGKERPNLLKVSLGYRSGLLGEGEISYAGSYALERAKMAGDILKERLINQIPDLRIDYIGLNSVHRKEFEEVGRPYEIRVRAAGYHHLREGAALIGEEVESLYLNGPSGGGGARKKVTELIGVVSTFISRNKVAAEVIIEEGK